MRSVVSFWGVLLVDAHEALHPRAGRGDDKDLWPELLRVPVQQRLVVGTLHVVAYNYLEVGAFVVTPSDQECARVASTPAEFSDVIELVAVHLRVHELFDARVVLVPAGALLRGVAFGPVPYTPLTPPTNREVRQS